jgi:site-specific DNA-cytosine methylase
MLELQGLPTDFFGDKCGLTSEAKKRVIGNGVPRAMALAVARAVKKAIGSFEEASIEKEVR